MGRLTKAMCVCISEVKHWNIQCQMIRKCHTCLSDFFGQFMQCRLPATIRCLSHPSAHVRALSTSVLRDILHTGSIKPTSKQVDLNGMHGPSYQYFNLGVIDWQADIEKCLTWEAHSRLATGMPIQYLDTAAKELGCTISV